MLKKIFVIFLIFNIASISTMTTNSTAFDDGSEKIVSCSKIEIDGGLLARNDMECDCQNGSLLGEWLIQKEGYRCIINHACSHRENLLLSSILSKKLRSEGA